MGVNKIVLAMMLASSIMMNPQEGEIENLNSLPMEEVREVEKSLEETREEFIEDKEYQNQVEESVKIEEVEEIKKEIVKFKINNLELRQGIVNEEVLRLKKFFREKGYNNIEENYNFDYRLNEIVVEYQRHNGLLSNGIVGKNTYETINKDMELNSILIPQIKIKLTNDNIPKELIVINKDNNTLYHIRGGQIINRYPVGTGKTPAYTPEGKFTIVNKLIDPAWGGAGKYTPVRGGAPNNPLGRRWMGLSIKGGGTYGIHGNSDKSSIGKYISLGCIRMFNEDVEELFNKINIGTPVWLGNEVRLKEYGVIVD